MTQNIFRLFPPCYLFLTRSNILSTPLQACVKCFLRTTRGQFIEHEALTLTVKVFWQRFLFFQAELMRQNQVARSLLVWCNQPDNEASFCLFTQRETGCLLLLSVIPYLSLSCQPPVDKCQSVGVITLCDRILLTGQHTVIQ